MKIIILEHIGESGNWEWYEIYKASRFKGKDKEIQAMQLYINKMGLEKQQMFEHRQDGFYATVDDLRAYYHNI